MAKGVIQGLLIIIWGGADNHMFKDGETGNNHEKLPGEV